MHYERDDTVYRGLYSELEKRTAAELMEWYDARANDEPFSKWIVLSHIVHGIVEEDVERFIAWIEDDSDWDTFAMRDPSSAVSLVASVDRQRAIDWIRELERRRALEPSDNTSANDSQPGPPLPVGGPSVTTGARQHSASAILGFGSDSNAFKDVAAPWFELDPRGFLDWVLKELRARPTAELYSSWHGAIADVATSAKEEDIPSVEKAMFRMDGGAVNFPAIAWYLADRPDSDVSRLAAKWLGPASSATPDQQNQLKKAFGFAKMWSDPAEARRLFQQLYSKSDQEIYLHGFTLIEQEAGTGAWMNWQHDTGLRQLRY